MNNIINHDKSPYVQDVSLELLWDAVELLIITNNSNIVLDLEQKKELLEAENVVQAFISQINLRANLITGNYEAGLKMVAPIFFDSESTLKEVHYQSMIIALLARLKKQNKIQWNMSYSNIESQRLNNLVDQYISGNLSSLSSVISIIISQRVIFQI